MREELEGHLFSVFLVIIRFVALTTESLVNLVFFIFILNSYLTFKKNRGKIDNAFLR